MTLGIGVAVVLLVVVLLRINEMKREMKQELAELKQELARVANRRCGGDFLADARVVTKIRDAERWRLADARNGPEVLCLATGCEQPVAGSILFKHCLSHLDATERDWMREIATIGSEEEFVRRQSTPTGNPLRDLFRQDFPDRVKNIAEQKREAALQASAIVKHFEEKQREWIYVPRALWRRHKSELEDRCAAEGYDRNSYFLIP